MWNALPEQVVSAKSVESFEARLDKFLRGQEFVYDYRANIKIAGTGSQITLHAYVTNYHSFEDSFFKAVTKCSFLKTVGNFIFQLRVKYALHFVPILNT